MLCGGLEERKGISGGCGDKGRLVEVMKGKVVIFVIMFVFSPKYLSLDCVSVAVVCSEETHCWVSLPVLDIFELPLLIWRALESLSEPTNGKGRA